MRRVERALDVADYASNPPNLQLSVAYLVLARPECSA
jgi:hypothetical protein